MPVQPLVAVKYSPLGTTTTKPEGTVAEARLREQPAPSESVGYWPLAIDLL